MRTPLSLLDAARRIAAPLLLLFCCGGCYYHQMLPETTICAQDPQGRPVAGLSGKWHGYANEGQVPDRPFEFGPDGCAHIARYNMWTSPLNFVGGLLSGLLPHSGGFGLRGPVSDVY